MKELYEINEWKTYNKRLKKLNDLHKKWKQTENVETNVRKHEKLKIKDMSSCNGPNLCFNWLSKRQKKLFLIEIIIVKWTILNIHCTY